MPNPADAAVRRSLPDFRRLTLEPECAARRVRRLPTRAHDPAYAIAVSAEPEPERHFSLSETCTPASRRQPLSARLPTRPTATCSPRVARLPPRESPAAARAGRIPAPPRVTHFRSFISLSSGIGTPPSARRRTAVRPRPDAAERATFAADASGVECLPSDPRCCRPLWLYRGMADPSYERSQAPAWPRGSRSRCGSTRPRSATRSCSRRLRSTTRHPQPPASISQPVPLAIFCHDAASRSRDRLTRRRAAIVSAIVTQSPLPLRFTGRGVPPALPRKDAGPAAQSPS